MDRKAKEYKELAEEYKESLIALGGAIRIMVDSIRDIKCKYCESRNIVRFGHYKGIQRYFCKICKHKFTLADTLPKGQVPIRQIADAVGMYYRGMSLNNVSEHLENEYGVPITNAGIYNWLMRYSKQAKEKAEDYKPNVGDVWVADETVLKIGGKNIWFWDLIDAKTRFLLASHISTTRTTKDAKELVEKAATRANKTPKIIITDKLAAYLDGIELAFGADTKHIAAKNLTSSPGTQLIERFHGTLKDRANIMRGMKEVRTAQILLDGWLVHYNFFRPHDSLKGKMPAEVAGIKFPYANWEALIRSNKLIIMVSEESKYRPIKRYQLHLAKRTLQPKRRTRQKPKPRLKSPPIVTVVRSTK